MAILSGIPVLNCHSIEKTLAFYLQLLQFVVVKKRELNDELRWVHIMHGDTTLMLQAIPKSQQATDSVNPSSSNSKSISLYFYINNIKELHHFIKAKHASVSEMILSEYKMQEFSLIDPEGNTIVVGQKI